MGELGELECGHWVWVWGDVVANRNYNEHGGCYRSEDAEDSIRQVCSRLVR